MTKGYFHVLLVTGIISTMVLSSNTNGILNQNIYAHMFTLDDTASFLAFADQLRVESELVKTNLGTNNLLLAQKHANKAAALLTPGIVIEIAEKNQKTSDDLTKAVNDLQKISSSSEKQRQMVNQLISRINSTLGEAVKIRLEEGQGSSSSNFLEKGIEFLRGIFGGNSEGNSKNSNDGIKANSTTQSLAFANLVDSILINYGNAYAVDFDMANISNMAMMGGGNSSFMATSSTSNDNNNSMNMGMNMSSSMMMNMDSENKKYTLVDMADYQSAQALAAKAQEIFNNELKPVASNKSSAFITNLQGGLAQLNNSIEDKALPMDIMMIVHTQIHPNLLKAFNLKLR
jgi:hypothetical protein